MLVKLKVLSGASTGKEITVSSKQLLIGRGEECHLRPRSDSVSRRHCVLTVGDSRVSVKDLGSRNGTLVNGEAVTGERLLQPGDQLRVGRLEFEVLIDHGLGGAKKPKIRDVKEAVERSVRVTVGDEDIFDWLEEGDEADRARKLADPETRQFKLDETDRVVLQKATPETPATPKTPAAPADAAAKDAAAKDATAEDSSAGDEVDDDESADGKGKKKKKQPGKLPKLEQPKAIDTQSAAADTLRKFFNRR